MGFFKQIQSILNKNELPSAENVARTQPQPERRRRKRLTHKGRRILIVDDSATIVASLGTILKSAGCKISDASDAETGIETARLAPPDLVFLDIVLPGMNGFAALRQIRRDVTIRDTPVIMISGNEQATEQFYAKRIGADDFMKKPFSRHEVFARLEMLVATGKLPRLEPGTTAANAELRTIADLAAPPGQSPGATPRALQQTANLSNEAIARMTALEARGHLTAMGLQYFNQDQFSAAIERGDRLAIDLFIIGGGVEITA